MTAAGPPSRRGTGRGAAIAWTWNSAGHRGGNYTWTMEAGAATRPAQGTFGRASVPAPTPAPAPSFLSALTVDPPVISPDGDGVADALTVSYELSVRASVTATVLDATGAVAATLFSAAAPGGAGAVVPVRSAGPRGRELHVEGRRRRGGRANGARAGAVRDRPHAHRADAEHGDTDTERRRVRGFARGRLHAQRLRGGDRADRAERAERGGRVLGIALPGSAECRLGRDEWGQPGARRLVRRRRDRARAVRARPGTRSRSRSRR